MEKETKEVNEIQETSKAKMYQKLKETKIEVKTLKKQLALKELELEKVQKRNKELELNIEVFAQFFEVDPNKELDAIKSLKVVKYLKDKIEKLTTKLEKRQAYIKVLERVVQVLKDKTLSEYIETVDEKTEEIIEKFLKSKNVKANKFFKKVM